MKLITFLLILPIVSCCSPEKDPGPKISESFIYKNYNDEDLPTFLVEIELILFSNQISEYPEVFESFKTAIQEWASIVPVRVDVYLEDKPESHLFFGSGLTKRRSHAIEVHIANIQTNEYGYEDSISSVGAWEPIERRLLLDGDTLQKHPEIATSVAMHEIGHMFGLPHIVNPFKQAKAGYIILSYTEDAQTYVMYPDVVMDKLQNKISELEKKLATHYIKYVLTTPMAFVGQERCLTNLLDKNPVHDIMK